MLKFHTIEVINKVFGFAITALLARILTTDFGTYLYYQNIFTYLYAFALFSSDYNFLVNYSIGKDFIHSAAYYHTLLIKLILVTLIVSGSVFFLLLYPTAFAFWPYLVSVVSSLFVYDFILYIENDKKKLILYRFLSQAVTLGTVLLFYFRLADPYYITVIQAVQTVLLTAGTFLAARKYLPGIIRLEAFRQSLNSFRFSKIRDVSSYFLIRNFIIFFTTIEIILLANRQMHPTRDIFAEGLRLSGVLMPFALFYINFNINKIGDRYYKAITGIALLLLLASPVYVLLFMGDTFTQNTYQYNFFIWAFAFNAFLEKDYVEFLTQDNERKSGLLTFNLIFFLASAVLFGVLLFAGVSMLPLILFYTLKLLVYYLFLIRKFSLRLSYRSVAVSCLAIAGSNFLLQQLGYYRFAFTLLTQLKHVLV